MAASREGGRMDLKRIIPPTLRMIRKNDSLICRSQDDAHHRENLTAMGSTFREGDLPRGLAGVEYWTRRRVDFRLSGSTGGFGRTVSAGPWCPQLAKGAGFRMRCCRSPALRKKLRSGATVDRHAKKTNPSSRS